MNKPMDYHGTALYPGDIVRYEGGLWVIYGVEGGEKGQPRDLHIREYASGTNLKTVGAGDVEWTGDCVGG